MNENLFVIGIMFLPLSIFAQVSYEDSFKLIRR